MKGEVGGLFDVEAVDDVFDAARDDNFVDGFMIEPSRDDVDERFGIAPEEVMSGLLGDASSDVRCAGIWKASSITAPSTTAPTTTASSTASSTTASSTTAPSTTASAVFLGGVVGGVANSEDDADECEGDMGGTVLIEEGLFSILH